MVEEIHIDFIRRDPEDRNVTRELDPNIPEQTHSSFACHWEKNGHPVGLWVEYGPNVSHKEAFSVLVEGVWEALQRPDDFDISIDKYLLLGDREGNPPCYRRMD